MGKARHALAAETVRMLQVFKPGDRVRRILGYPTSYIAVGTKGAIEKAVPSDGLLVVLWDGDGPPGRFCDPECVELVHDE